MFDLRVGDIIDVVFVDGTFSSGARVISIINSGQILELMYTNGFTVTVNINCISFYTIKCRF